MGHKLWQALSPSFPDTFVTIRKPLSCYVKCGLFSAKSTVEGVDLRDFTKVNSVLADIRPDIVLNCVGITPRKEDAQDNVSAITINSLLPHKLAEWCANNGSRLIHFSTDCVFDGKKGGYDESSPPDSKDLYGMTKALGEVKSPCVLVIRTSMIGREIFGGTELLEWFLAQKGKRVKGFRKALFTGLPTNRLAALTRDLIGNFPSLSGVFNVSSPAISKNDLLHMMRDAYKIDVEIEPDDKFECRRDLNGDKFIKQTGFACPPWTELIREMVADPTPYDLWRQ